MRPCDASLHSPQLPGPLSISNQQNRSRPSTLCLLRRIRSIFICVSSFEDSVSSFVNHDLLEVCLLSQRSDLLLSAPLQNGIRFLQPPLPAASTACLAAQLAPERAKHRASLVPFERHE